MAAANISMTGSQIYQRQQMTTAQLLLYVE